VNGEPLASPGGNSGKRPRSSLLINRNFALLWSAQTISTLGTRVDALPFVALLVLRGTPFQMALLAAVEAAPALGLGLAAGVVADRFRRRPIMLLADVGRMVLLLSVPLAAAAGTLHLAHLLVVAVLVGTLTVAFDVSYGAILPSVVPRSRLIDANSRLGVSSSTTEVVGPGLSGILVQLISAPGAVLLDALSFGASALCLAGMSMSESSRERTSVTRTSVREEVAEGLSTVWRSPILRALALSSTISTFFGGFFAALYGYYLLRVLHLTPAGLGIAVAAGGAGELLGVAAAQRMARRLGVGPAILVAASVGRAGGFFLLLAGGAPGVALLMVAVGQLADFEYGVRGVHEATLVQRMVPDRLLGRVHGSMQFMARGVFPFGILTAGVLGETIGVRATVWIAVVGSIPGLLVLLASPLRHLREMPDAVPEVVR
jgi:MFS family permease